MQRESLRIKASRTWSFLFCQRPHGLSSTISLSSSLSSSFSSPEVFSWTDIVIIFQQTTTECVHINSAHPLHAKRARTNVDSVCDTRLRVVVSTHSLNKPRCESRCVVKSKKNYLSVIICCRSRHNTQGWLNQLLRYLIHCMTHTAQLLDHRLP